MDNNDRNMKTGSKFLIALAIVLAAGVIGMFSMTVSFLLNRDADAGIEEADNAFFAQTEDKKQLKTTTIITDVKDDNISDLSPVVEKTMPSIVAISSTTTATGYSFFYGQYSRDVLESGSGIIYDITDKNIVIMTNNHVVSGTKKLVITFNDGKSAEGTVKGTDANADLALVTVSKSDLEEETVKAIKAAEIGDSSELRVGQMVLAIGNALGYGQSLTVGYVSALNRNIMVDDREMSLIQTDAAINPGNSGGALISKEGKVIGINSVKLSAQAVEGMGYAIPMETALPILKDLKDVPNFDEEKGYLGIYYRQVTDDMNQLYNIPYGIYVSEVIEGGAAANAGVMQGDVITFINGLGVLDVDSVTSAMQHLKVGDVVDISLMRYVNGKYVNIDMKLTLTKKTWE